MMSQRCVRYTIPYLSISRLTVAKLTRRCAQPSLHCCACLSCLAGPKKGWVAAATARPSRAAKVAGEDKRKRCQDEDADSDEPEQQRQSKVIIHSDIAVTCL